MKKKLVYIAIGVVCVVLLAFQFAGNLAPILWRFDDPAIQACRHDILTRLKSPTSYSEVEVELHASSGNRVFIEYDASNSFGAMVRGTHMCRWVYFKDTFYFRLPFAENKKKVMESTSRWVNLNEERFTKIKDDETSLKPSFADRALAECIKATIDTKNWSYFPFTYLLDANVDVLRQNSAAKVRIRSIRNDNGLPKTAMCDVTKGDDGTPVTAEKTFLHW